MLLRATDQLPDHQSGLQVPEDADHTTVERRYRRLLHQLDPHVANSPRALAACQVRLLHLEWSTSGMYIPCICNPFQAARQAGSAAAH